MINKEIKKFEIKNITKYRKYRKFHNFEALISNIFFNVYENETTSFIFPDETEKEVLWKIFCGRDKRYEGYFEYNQEIYSAKSKNKINDIVSAYDISSIQSKNKKIDILSWLYEDISFEDYKKSINDKIKSQIELLNENKAIFIFETRKIELKILEKINELLKKTFEEIDEYEKRLIYHRDKNNVNEVTNNFNYIFKTYENYLLKRIELLYSKNSSLLNIFMNYEISNLNNNEQDIIIKLNRIKEEITKTYQLDINDLLEHKLGAKQKKQPKKSHQIKIIKNKNKSILKTLQKKYYYSAQKNKLIYLKAEKNESVYYLKYIVDLSCYQFIKKNINKLAYLDKKQMSSFLNEFQFQYSLLFLNIKEKKIKLGKKRNLIFRLQLSMIINQELLKFIASYKALSSHNKKIITNENNIDIDDIDINKNENKKINSIENSTRVLDKNELEYKKLEFKNLYDEYEWLRTSSVKVIGKEVNETNKQIEQINEQYNKLKKQLIDKINKIIEIKNQFFKQVSTKQYFKKTSEISSFNEKELFDLIVKHENLYNDLQKDILPIENIFKNDKNFIKNIHKLLFKYHIYNYASKLNISIFDLKICNNAISPLLRSKIIFLKSLLSRKKIVVIKNLFDNLNDSDLNEFIEIYSKNISKENKIWIHLTSDLKKVSIISEKINIIYMSKSIEFGNTKQIINNPICAVTVKLLEIDGKIGYSIDKEGSDNIHLEEGYDYYKIENNHYVYGEIYGIYNLTKKIPLNSSLTVENSKIEQLENSIAFAKYLDNKKDSFVQDYKEETIIIDVTKEI